MKESSKCMDKAKDFCWKIQPNFDSQKFWKLKGWADDSERGLFSVTGLTVYLQNVPVCWRSIAQRGVTSSSSKAEYVVMS